MKKEMLINVLQPEECRIAIIEDGVLEELYVERTSHESYTGNIYKGRIVNLEPAIQAAFVDFSVGRNGFLHVSDVEPQYFDRPEGPHAETDSGPRDRDRERKRDPRRGRGRDDRRGPAPRPDLLDPPPAGMSPAPPRLEDRPRERGRERDRGRERERPDQSIKGRRDRSEPPPRRFGEGLVEPPEAPLEPPLPTETIPPSWPPVEEPPDQSLPETSGADLTAQPDAPADVWDLDVSWSRERESDFGTRSEPVRERGPFREEADEPPARGFRPIEPLDPDLPPSRTQRSRGPADPARAGDIEGDDRGRHRPPPALPSPIDEWPEAGAAPPPSDFESPGGRDPRRGRGRGRSSPPGRSRPVSPVDREESLLPEPEPGLGPDELVREQDTRDISRPDEPPRRRGGRAAIRSRGGDWEGPRETPPPQDLRPERPTRGLPIPGEFEPERRRPPAPDRRADLEGRRMPATPEPPRDRDRDRERPKPHDRAGEPGYVPRRARLQSGEPAFGADVFPPGGEWPERDPEHLIEAESDPRLADLAEDDEPGLFGDEGGAGTGGAARPEGRRRRRRRGRRRERPKTDPSGPASPLAEPDFDDFGAEAGPSQSFARGRAPVDDHLDDLDDLDLEDIEAPGRESFEGDEFGGDLLADRPAAPVEEEIDLELEQEIRREIEEIEELEREMGLRGPADARPRRGEEPAARRADRVGAVALSNHRFRKSSAGATRCWCR